MNKKNAETILRLYELGEPEQELSSYYQVSQYGFINDDRKNKEVKYVNSKQIAIHLLLSREVVSIELPSRSTNINRLRDDFNPLPNQVKMTRIYIIDGILDLIKLGIIQIRFINDDNKEFQTLLNDKELEDVKTKLNNNELFDFKQTLIYSDDNKPMFFRFFESHFQRLVANESFEIMREAVGNKDKGISVKFDYFSVLGVISSSLNVAPIVSDEKEDHELYEGSINFAGQKYISNRTSNSLGKNNSVVGVDRVNKIDQSLRRDFAIFSHVKARRPDSNNWEWTIFRSFHYDRETLYKFVYYEFLNEDIVDILPIKFIDNTSEYKEVAHKNGFDNLEDEYKEIMSKIQSYGIEFSKVNQLHKLNEISEEIFGEGKKMTDATEDEIALLRIALNKIEELEIEHFELLKDEINEDEKKSSLAEEDKENRYANDIQDNYTTNNKKSTQEKSSPFSRFAAEQKIVRIQDRNPYDEKFDEIISDLRNLIK